MSSTSAEAPKLVKAGVEDAMPPAALAGLASFRAFLTSGRGGEGRGLRTQRRPGGFRGTSLRIRCLREDFLDYSPTPLPVDLDPAQGTVKSPAPLCVHAPPPFKASPQVQGQKGLGLPVLRRPCFLVPLS